MQKNIILVLISLLLTTLSFAQVNVKDIVFKKETIDFGRIFVENGIVTAEYSFINNGSETFEIEEIDAACGCTNPRASSMSIAPGEKGKILAEFNPKGMIGEVDKWIYVRGNFNNQFQVRLNFTADITSYQMMKTSERYPGEFGYLILDRVNVSFGTMYNQSVRYDSIKLTNEGASKIEVLSVAKTPSFITVEGLPLSVEAGSVSYLKIKIDPNATDTVGPYFGDIKLKTNDRFFPAKTISYRMTFQDDYSNLSKRKLKKAPKIELSSYEIDFGTMGSGGVKKMPLEITNTGKTPLVIKRIDADCTCAILTDFKKVISPGETIQVIAQFDAMFKNGNQKKPITIYSNDPIHPKTILFLKTKIK
jgi:hypothetical protein